MEQFTTIDPRQIRSASFMNKVSFLKELTGKPFKIALVTPLLAFSTNEMYLRRVSNALTDEIAATFPEATATVSRIGKANSSSLLCAKLSATLGEKAVYEAYLFSLSASKITTHATMPFLCSTVAQNPKVVDAVISFIEREFACSVFPCILSNTQFLWMWGITVSETLRRNKDVEMTVSYSVHGSAVHLTLSDDTVSGIWDSWYTFRELQCNAITSMLDALEFLVPLGSRETRKSRGTKTPKRPKWTLWRVALLALDVLCTCVNFDPECNDVSWNDIQQFRDAVLEHFLNVYQVDTSPFPIERVVFDCVSMSILAEGLRLKVMTSDILFVLLKFVETACIKPNSYLSPNWRVEAHCDSE